MEDAAPARIKEVVIRNGHVWVHGHHVCQKVPEPCMAVSDAKTLKSPASQPKSLQCARCGRHVTTVRSVQDYILSHTGHMGYLDGTR